MRASLLSAAALGAACAPRGRARTTPPPPQATSREDQDRVPDWELPGAQASAQEASDPEPAAPPPVAEASPRPGSSSASAPRPAEPPRRSSVPPPAPHAPERGDAYQVLPEVSLSPEVERKVAMIAESYHRRTGKTLVLTSGTRDVARQAEAMHELLRLGADLSRIYKNREAVKEVTAAYQRGRAERRPPRAVIEAVADVLREQMQRGVYVSAHLRAGAVDVRSRGMSASDKRAFVAGVEEVGGAEVIEEVAPPHFHVELE